MVNRIRRVQAVACLVVFLAPLFQGYTVVFAESRNDTLSPTERLKSEEAPIPKKPSAPPKLGAGNRAESDLFRCPRRYVYRKKTLNCDSHLGWDGENLRPALGNSAEALAELNHYQSNREKVETLRYVGGAGLALIVGGFLISKFMPFEDPRGNAIKKTTFIAGTTMAVGALSWGLIVNNSNHKHLLRAIDTHNEEKTSDPIELQVSTGVNF